MIADWLSSAGLGAVKPLLTALMLPPTPFIVLALVGAWRAGRQRRGGWTLALLACIGLWLGLCTGSAQVAQAVLLRPPPPLSAAQRDALKARAAGGEKLAIVVLGGGVDRRAVEYDAADLHAVSLQRLRYGLWLGRATGIPVAMSGGAGWAVRSGIAVEEAAVGARIAANEFGQPLRWQETASRDTHENAVDSVALLGDQGVQGIVLVTNDWHMPRSMSEFRAAAALHVPPLTVEAAPMGAVPDSSLMPLLDWMPSGEGALAMRQVLREALGRLFAH